MQKELEVDVVEFKLHFPTWFWIRTILLGIVLVPLRIFLILIMLSVFWLTAVLISFTGTDLSRHLNGINVYLAEWIGYIVKLTLFWSGLVTTYEGVESEDAPIVVVGPHTAFIDGWVAYQAKPRSIGVMTRNFQGVPFIGEFLVNVINS